MIAWPLIIPYIMAKIVKHDTSLGILFISTGAYASFYFLVAITSSSTYFCGLRLFVLSLLSIPVMIPAWIVALLLNVYYTKKSVTDPGIAQGIALSCGSLEK